MASSDSTLAPRPVAEIASYHAHIYYDLATTRAIAEQLRTWIGERFLVRLGRWHDAKVGPHDRPMFQVAFDVAVFAGLVPWLALHREGLSVLVHPNTLAPLADHLVHALWLGPPLPLRTDVLPESIDAAEESAVVPDT